MTHIAPIAALASLALFVAMGGAGAQQRQGNMTSPQGEQALEGGDGLPERLQRAQIKARAQLKNKQGQDAGTVVLAQYQGAVVIHGDLRGLPPGWHAMHAHRTGRCEPDFEAAGDHFNPVNVQHGLDAPQRHAGDLPNILVGQDGTAQFELITTQFSLGPSLVASGQESRSGASGAAATGRSDAQGMVPSGFLNTAPTIMDNDGAAIVIHSEPDDYRSNPSGDAADRIACGVIER